MPRKPKDEYADLCKLPEPKKPAPSPEAITEIVGRFLCERTFLCSKMHNARITLEYCVERQRPKPAYRSAYAPKFNDHPNDLYCLSGKCELGLQNKKKLEGKQPWATETSYRVTPATSTSPTPPSPKPSSKGSRSSSRRRRRS